MPWAQTNPGMWTQFVFPGPQWWAPERRALGLKLPWGAVVILCPECFRGSPLDPIVSQVSPGATVHLGCPCGAALVLLVRDIRTIGAHDEP